MAKMDFIVGDQTVENGLQIGTAFDYEQFNRSIENEAYMVIALRAPEIEVEEERTPLAISACLDVSYSMFGEKLLSLKKSTKKMIQNLTARDTLGVVVFSTAITEVLKPLPMTPENKALAIAAVDKLAVQDSTNLSGGFIKSVEQLNSLKTDKGTIRRVLIFTDGQANEGVQGDNLIRLVKEMTGSNTLSSFGYGNEYNEDLMQALVNEGKGNCYYIQSPEDIPQSFARELGGLISVFAQNIKVEVAFSNDVEVLESYSEFTTEKNGKTITVELPDIYSEEIRNVLFKVKLPKADEGKLPVVGVNVSYFNMVEKVDNRVKSSGSVQMVQKVDEPRKINQYVGEQVAIAEAAKAQKEAMEKANLGDFASARSIMTDATGFVKGLAGMGIQCDSVSSDLTSVAMAYSDERTYGGSHNFLSNTVRGYSTGRSLNRRMAYGSATPAQVLMERSFTEPEPETEETSAEEE